MISVIFFFLFNPSSNHFDTIKTEGFKALAFYISSGLVVSYGYHHYFRTRGQIEFLKKQAVDEQNKKEEIFGLYEQITAQEEELRANYGEVKSTQEALELRDKRLQNLYSVSQEAFWEINVVENTFYFTDQLTQMFGYDYDQLKDLLKNPQKYIHPSYFQSIEEDLENFKYQPRASLNKQTMVRTKKGDYLWVQVNWVADYDEQGNLSFITGSFKNIHQEKTAQEELYQAAFHDPLTGIPNRNAFNQKLNLILDSCNPSADQTDIFGAVVILDLDDFKWLNDSFGHSFGDQLLIEIVKRFSLLTDPIFIARLGGDEFAFILENETNEEAIREKVKKTQDTFNTHFQINKKEIQVNPSTGVVFYPKDGSTVEEILKHADTALNLAKTQGKNQVVIFDPSMNVYVQKRMALEINLKKAIRKEKFSLVYQPQYQISPKRLIGVEALLRWWNPDLGHVSPAEFIPLAEANGLIIELGEWAMKHAFNMAKRLNENREIPIIMSINISPNQLLKSDFINRTIELARQLKVNPHWITFEITETALMRSFETSIQKIQALTEFGFKFALDDFGTGYSSLSYLLSIPSKLLKIDRSFIRDLPNSPKHIRLVNTIIEVAHDLNMDVMAEGVETEEQLGILQQYNQKEGISPQLAAPNIVI